jgi:pimeloyl-ACP methyl ester carboxylesterase
MRVVVRHLAVELGYMVALVVGHSRGSVAALSWMCASEEGSHVRGFVNVSGRYRMDVREHPAIHLHSMNSLSENVRYVNMLALATPNHEGSSEQIASRPTSLTLTRKDTMSGK